MSEDKTLRLWDTHAGQPLADPATRHSWWVNSVAFSPDGHLLCPAATTKPCAYGTSAPVNLSAPPSPATGDKSLRGV